MTSSQTVLALTVGCAFTFGLLIVLLSSMRSHLATHLRLDEARVDSLWAAMNFVLVPLTFVAGLLIDLTDIRWVVLGGSLIIALAMILLRSARSFMRAWLAYLLVAAGGACISASAIVLMPLAFFGPGEASASLNMGNVFFAVGALMAPALADVLLRSLGTAGSLSVLALGALIPGVIAMFASYDAVPPIPKIDFLKLLTDPVILLAASVFFLYAPLEGCLHTWASGFLSNLGNSERDIHRLIAGFWSCFLLGRLVMAYMQHVRWLPEHAERWIVFVLGFGATVMLGNLAGTENRSNGSTSFLLLAFFLGPIFPTLVGFLFSIADPQGQGDYPFWSGTVFGILFALGSAGSLLFTPLISARVHRRSAQAAITIPVALSIALMLASFVFALWPVER